MKLKIPKKKQCMEFDLLMEDAEFRWIVRWISLVQVFDEYEKRFKTIYHHICIIYSCSQCIAVQNNEL